MLVRIFEYAAQIALDEGEIIHNRLKVEIPNSAVLFLRSKASTPDKMEIEMKTPGGTICFDVPVMKAQRYTIEEIFDKKLLFLIPFHIFSHESRFEEYEREQEKLGSLVEEYEEIVRRLDERLEKGLISVYVKKTILEMSGKVLEHIAKNYENLRKEVKAVMGGRVLEYEAKTILKEGMQKQARDTAWNLHVLGLDDDTIAKMVNVKAALVKEWFAESYGKK